MTENKALGHMMELVENADSDVKMLVEEIMIYSQTIIMSAVAEVCDGSDSMIRDDKAFLAGTIIARISEYILPLLRALDDGYTDKEFSGTSFARDCGAIMSDEAIRVSKETLEDGRVAVRVEVGQEHKIPNELKSLIETMMVSQPAKA